MEEPSSLTFSILRYGYKNYYRYIFNHKIISNISDIDGFD